MFRRVAQNRHFVFVDQAFDFVDVAGLQVRCIGVGPAAPQLDVIVAELLRIGKAVLQRIALIAGRKHAKFHHRGNLLQIKPFIYLSSLTQGSKTSTTRDATPAPSSRHSTSGL